MGVVRVSVRAIIIGLAGAAVIAAVAYFNDNIMRQTLLIGNHMPYSVYGTLLVFLLLVNPGIAWLRKRWAFTGGELAVVLALTLAGCAIPGAGLMRFFTNAVMLPHHKARTRPGWIAEDALDMAPGFMLAGTPLPFQRDDFADPAALCSELAREVQAGTLSPPRRRVWESLSEAHRGRILAAGGEAAPAACADVLVGAFNSLLEVRGLYRPESFPGAGLAPEARKLLGYHADEDEEEEGEATGEWATRVAALDARRLKRLNRYLIDSAWPKAIESHAARRHKELYTFRSGVKERGGAVMPWEVPWSAWVRPLVFWLPLVVVLSAGVLGLAVVLHKQWAEHEHLPYPVARFVEALLPKEGETRGSILRNRLFLSAVAVVLAIHLNNYIYAWWPRYFVRIPMRFDFSALQQLSTMMSGGVARWAIFTIRIYFVAVGLSYFVASDVSLSIGIAAPLSAYVGGTLAYYGISAGGSGLYSGSPMQTFKVGTYVGIMVMLVYTGRRYYAGVFRRALFLKTDDEVAAETVWGARVFLFSATLFVVYLASAGIDWQLAVIYTVLAFTLFTVMSRILAETGMFFMEPRWYPCAFIVVMFGVRAIGPTTALLMFLVSTMLLVVPREALMPFVMNSLKVASTRGVPGGKTTLWCGVAVLVALVVAVPVTLMFQYGSGTHHWDTWGTGAVPRYSFDKAVELKQRVKSQGALEESETVKGFARFGRIDPETRSVIGFGIGLAVVLLLAAARLRITWWPLHPVLVVMFWNYPCCMFWCSFLVGWSIKKAVVRFGGHRSYRRFSPVMLGLIAGDLLGVLIPSVVGAIYYLVTGEPALSFAVMPD